jgi:fatty-acyl-CoA synthase
MPASSTVPNLLCYEDLIDAHSPEFTWPTFDENTASSLCYTSGTTGNPKGALYSHRSTVLHTYACALPDSLDCSSSDTILPGVPMFHVNAWGLPYVACMVGAKLVFPGPWLDGKSLHDLFETESVTMAAGVPTVWQGLLAHVDANELKFSSHEAHRHRRIDLPAGHDGCLRGQVRRPGDPRLGMTELSPMGALGKLKGKHAKLDAEQRRALQAKQGPVALRHRHEDRRRARRRTSARRPGLGRADGSRSLGHLLLLQR